MIEKELTAIEQAVKAFTTAMAATQEGNKDFIPAKRKERLKAAAGPLIAKALSVCDESRAALDARFKNTASVIQSKTQQATKPKSEIRELIDFLRTDSIRRELQTMSIADRGQVFRQACKAGDELVINSFKNTLQPMIDPQLLENELQRIESERVEKVAPVESDILTRLSDARSELNLICEGTREALIKELSAYELTPRDLSAATAMTAEEKMIFIEKNGLDAFKKLVDGI